MNEQYSVGEFSQKTGVSIRTLHYYDEVGLLSPVKHQVSGHRLYSHQNLLQLQKILSLKFLGYTLEEIAGLMGKETFDKDLIETLKLQEKALLKQSEQVNSAIKAVNRTIRLLQEEGEMDSDVLISLINNMKTEQLLREWLEEHTSKDLVEQLYNKPEEDKIKLDKESIKMSKEIKKLFGMPLDHPDVKRLVERHINISMEYLGEEAVNVFAGLDISEEAVLELMEKAPSPLSKEEEDWLNQAMEHYMIQLEEAEDNRHNNK